MEISKKREKPVPVKKELVPGVVLGLPSLGKDYEGEAHENRFHMRAPLVAEVEFFAELTPENYENSLTEILRALIASPQIDPSMLTDGDRTFLYLWVRAQIHPSYHLTVTCRMCGKVHPEYPYQISSIPLKPVPAGYEGPKTLTLPISGEKASFRMRRGADEDAVSVLKEAGVKKFTAVNCVTLHRVGDETFERDPFAKAEWFRSLAVGDAMHVHELNKWLQHGPEFSACPFVCPTCNRESKFVLPFRPEFFFPTVPFRGVFGDAVDGSDPESGVGGSEHEGAGGDGDSEVPVVEDASV